MAEVLIPYIWAATGLVMLVAIVVAIFWAYQHNQFNEDIKDPDFHSGRRRPIRCVIGDDHAGARIQAMDDPTVAP